MDILEVINKIFENLVKGEYYTEDYSVKSNGQNVDILSNKHNMKASVGIAQSPTEEGTYTYVCVVEIKDKDLMTIVQQVVPIEEEKAISYRKSIFEAWQYSNKETQENILKDFKLS